jgi:DNA-binding HxlR family transcriptional regulator
MHGTNGKPHSDCPMERLFDVIGGKWKVVIIWWLQDGPKRFSELRRSMPGVTQKMLTQQLRQLERDGLLSREVYPEVPPRVEYSLTPLGTEFRTVLGTLCQWAERFMPEVEAAQERARAAISPTAAE